GTLISLLLPALQSSREAVRRVACGNNLHQQGIALHSYHASVQTFPSAFEGTRDNYYAPHWSWSAYLLPYLDESPVHEVLGVGVKQCGYGAAFAPPCDASQLSLPVFVCPSDIGPRLNQRKGFHAKSNYRGVAGTQNLYYGTYDSLSNQNGVLYINSSLP